MTRRLFPSFPESIIAFAWEPNGSKFAVLHGESPRISVSFYHVNNNGKIDLISEWSENPRTHPGPSDTPVCPVFTVALTFPLFSTEMFDKQQANSIFWSPQGQFLVLAGLRRSVDCSCPGSRL